MSGRKTKDATTSSRQRVVDKERIDENARPRRESVEIPMWNHSAEARVMNSRDRRMSWNPKFGELGERCRDRHQDTKDSRSPPSILQERR